MNTVDLNQIVERAKGYYRLKPHVHTQIGAPWFQLDRLKITVVKETWSKDQPVTPKSNVYPANKENGCLKFEKCVTSKVGCKLTISDGIALGYEKSVDITGPTQNTLVPLKIRPGKLVTDNVDTVSIALGSVHSNPSSRLATDLVEEYKFTGRFQLEVKLSGNVTIVDYAGNEKTNLPFAEIVCYLKASASPAVSCLEVHNKQGIPHHVTWTIKGDAEIYGPFKQTIAWQ